ncbi:MAG TPA: hypothetical protein VJ385_01375 [Fibrobacteria bacterium]|nr:hypothetical protein [Fibrobacteria bacterium]
MKNPRRSFHCFLGALAVSALWLGCATAPRFPAGEAILKGEPPGFPPAPDSLRAELELTVFAGGRKSSVSAAFLAKPWRAYKLDLFGLPGMVAGSFLWTPERWTLAVFDREEYVEGAGEHVEIGNLGLKEMSVHDVFSFLWGDFFPGDGPSRDRNGGDTAGGSPAATVPEAMRNLGNGSFGYSAGGLRWRVSLDGKTGLVREALREDSAFRIGFSDYRAGGSPEKGRPVPRKVRLYRYREPLLEIKVESAEDNPHWRRDPFSIKVPKGFRKLERVGEGDASGAAPAARSAPK